MRVADGLKAHSTRYDERHQSSDEPQGWPLPKVMVAPTERSPICAIESVAGAPSMRKKRIGAALFGPAPMLGPSSQSTDAGPSFSIASTTAVATVANASSHETRCQRPSPRLPTRRNG